MRTPSGLYRTTPIIYACEMNDCPQCGRELVEMSYLNGLKTVQKMMQPDHALVRSATLPG
jgi:hypothetical protein